MTPTTEPDPMLAAAHSAWVTMKRDFPRKDLPVQVTLLEPDGRLVAVASAVEAERDDVMLGLSAAAASGYMVTVSIDAWRLVDSAENVPAPADVPVGYLGELAAAGDERVESILTTILFREGRMLAMNQAYAVVDAALVTDTDVPTEGGMAWEEATAEDWGRREDWSEADRRMMGGMQRALYSAEKALADGCPPLSLPKVLGILNALGWLTFIGVEIR